VRVSDSAARSRARSGSASRHPDSGRSTANSSSPTRQITSWARRRAFEKLQPPSAGPEFPFLIAVGVIDGARSLDIDHHDADVALAVADGRGPTPR